MKKFILSLIPLACTIAACNSVSIEEPDMYGTLSVALADEPVIEVCTKAVTELKKDSDDAKNYQVRIFNFEGVQQGDAVSFYDFKAQTLPFGTYYVTAENCTESAAEAAEEGNGQMRLAGKSSGVELSPEHLMNTASVECVVTNARVSVQFDSSIRGRLESLQVVLNGGTTPNRQIIVPESENVTVTWFNPSTLSYTISATGIKSITSEGKKLSAKDDILILVKASQGKLSVETINVDGLKKEDITGSFNPYL